MEKYDFSCFSGEQWSQLLSEHPEYADQCDWEKLNIDDWFEPFLISAAICRSIWLE